MSKRNFMVPKYLSCCKTDNIFSGLNFSNLPINFLPFIDIQAQIFTVQQTA